MTKKKRKINKEKRRINISAIVQRKDVQLLNVDVVVGTKDVLNHVSVSRSVVKTGPIKDRNIKNRILDKS